MIFARDGIEVQTGRVLGTGQARHYEDQTGAMRALAALYRAHGVSDVLQFFDLFFERLGYPSTLGTLIARPDPDEATTGYLMGFTVSGSKGAFVAPTGLVFHDHSPDDVHWRVA